MFVFCWFKYPFFANCFIRNQDLILRLNFYTFCHVEACYSLLDTVCVLLIIETVRWPIIMIPLFCVNFSIIPYIATNKNISKRINLKLFCLSVLYSRLFSEMNRVKSVCLRHDIKRSLSPRYLILYLPGYSVLLI